MGKKYIIEIPEDKITDFVGSTHFLMPYMMAGHIGHHDTGLPIEPYTEPDLEQVRKEAYDSGYDDAKGGYENGFENGMIVAWDAARKIGNMPYNEEENVFGSGGWAFIEKHTASEAIEKIRQYEQEKEESKKEQSVTVEDVMRQYLNEFCKKHRCNKDCVLNTDDFTCGRGNHFTTDSPVSDEEVRRAYAKVVKEK